MNKPSKGFLLFFFTHFVFSFPCLYAVSDSTGKKMVKEKNKVGKEKSELSELKHKTSLLTVTYVSGQLSQKESKRNQWGKGNL